MQTLSVAAPAKINLGLEVLRRRQDGYHDLNTIFAAIDVCDEVELRSRDDGGILCRVDGPFEVADDASNLGVLAARAVVDHLGRPDLGVEIALRKNIPVGAGLGGGSSDAAAVLRGLPTLWGVDLEMEAIQRLAVDLGSDVPFFLNGGLALGTSRGEVLQPLELTLPWTVVLINPGLHISTASAYAGIGRTTERPGTDLRATLAQALNDPVILPGMIVNDFEPSVFGEHPLLAELKARLYEFGAIFALMSGSGSTMFGLFTDAARAAEAAEMFDAFWCQVTTFRQPGNGMLSA